MLKSGGSRVSVAYKYVNSMLNVAYITGFVRRPEGRTFLIQQKNESTNLDHAIPVLVGDDIKVPREFTPITVTCHVYGRKEPGGFLRTAELRVIDMRTPSTRSMPLWLAWNASMPDGVAKDGFNPFKVGGSLKPEYTGEPDPENDPLRQILEATRGRLDTRLGENANVVMVAGVIEGVTYIRPTEHQAGYIAALIRQHADPDQCIPVRIYSDKPKAHLSSVVVGAPVKILGQARVKLLHADPEKPGDPPVVVGRQLYIRSGEFSVVRRPTDEYPGDIRTEPDWWKEMVARRRDEIKSKRVIHATEDHEGSEPSLVDDDDETAPVIVSDPTL